MTDHLTLVSEKRLRQLLKIEEAAKLTIARADDYGDSYISQPIRQVMATSDASHTESRIKPDLRATAYKAESQDKCARCTRPRGEHSAQILNCPIWTNDGSHIARDWDRSKSFAAPAQDVSLPNGSQVSFSKEPPSDPLIGETQNVDAQPVREYCRCGLGGEMHYPTCETQTQRACVHFAYWKREGRCLECQADDREMLAQPAEGYEPACGRCLARTESKCTCLPPAENE